MFSMGCLYYFIFHLLFWMDKKMVLGRDQFPFQSGLTAGFWSYPSLEINQIMVYVQFLNDTVLSRLPGLYLTWVLIAIDILRSKSWYNKIALPIWNVWKTTIFKDAIYTCLKIITNHNDIWILSEHPISWTFTLIWKIVKDSTETIFLILCRIKIW